jgi:hypothetical protein
VGKWWAKSIVENPQTRIKSGFLVGISVTKLVMAEALKDFLRDILNN